MCEYRNSKFPCEMKVTVVGNILHNPPASIPRENGLSVSIHVGTRKVRKNKWLGFGHGGSAACAQALCPQCIE